MKLDALDVALLAALRQHPRAGNLELSRVTGVARATVSARLQRLEEAGVVTGLSAQVGATVASALGAIEAVQRDL